MRIIAFLLLITLSLSGCTKAETEPVIVAEPELEQVSVTKDQEVTTFVEMNNYTYGKYEQESGCVIGAYILGDSRLTGGIEQFETLVGEDFGIYTYNMLVGEEFPLAWVMECYVAGAVPMITVRPQNHGDSFNMTVIDKLAADFGRFNIPLFIQLYPNPAHYDFDKEIYKKFWGEAKEVFAQKAPNTAFVWSVDNANTEEEMAYYPGDIYVDWVGTSIYKPLYKNGEVNTENIYSGLDYFYYTFQGKKPMMITSVGFSHYTTADHKYDIKGSMENIKEFYDKVEKEYPLIKAVIYADYTNAETSPREAVREDYTVTGDIDILGSFTSAVGDNYFLSQVMTETNDNPIVKYLLKSPYKSYYAKGKAYVNKSTYEYFLNQAVDYKTVVIKGEKYVEVDRGAYEIGENGIVLKGKVGKVY